MNVNTIIVAVAALFIGVGCGFLLAPEKTAVPAGAHVMPDGSIMSSTPSGNMHGAMGDMMAGLEGKTGDEFDEAFLSEMIVHHEGAVDMAKAALQNAKHAEIKSMADAIISAQTSEIAQMGSWLQAWYGREQ